MRERPAVQLTTEKKSVSQVLGDKQTFYLIPDYQRPYSWKDEEILTLWEDLRDFAFRPGAGSGSGEAGIEESREYFLGTMVMFKANQGGMPRQEIIDGQQRLTSLTLLLRAFYERLRDKTEDEPKNMRKKIEPCIWKTEGYNDDVVADVLKLDSVSALDADKAELKKILSQGWANPKWKSNYAKAYALFSNLVKKLEEENGVGAMLHFLSEILDNVVLLPIQTESQNTALNIFNTINDRGMPLRDSDLYKSRMYKYFQGLGKRDEFVSKWKEMEDRCANFPHKKDECPMDELFLRYVPYQLVYWERKNDLKGGANKSYLNKKTRNFLGKDSYRALAREEALKDLEDLSLFWAKAEARAGFSDRIGRLLLVLSLSPYRHYRSVVTTYYMRRKEILDNKDDEGFLDDEGFFDFLDRLAARIAGFAVMGWAQGKASTSLYEEMRKIEAGEGGNFAPVRFRKEDLRAAFFAQTFTKTRPAAGYLMAWRDLIAPGGAARLSEGMRAENLVFKPERASKATSAAYDRLGNMILTDGSIRIPQSSRTFAQRKRYFNRMGAQNTELLRLMMADDFTQADIARRDREIFQEIVDGLAARGAIRV